MVTILSTNFLATVVASALGIYLLMLAYRSAEHESLGISPCSMLFDREINLPIDLVLGRPEYNEYSHELKTVYADELSQKWSLFFLQIFLQR
jgi:hypothetical protein